MLYYTYNSTAFFVISKGEDDCSSRLKLARLEEKLDSRPGHQNLRAATHMEPIKPDLSSMAPRPQIDFPSYSPPKGS